MWQRARVPQQQRFCALLAIATARLPRTPQQALAAAREAEAVWPDRAEPIVLAARASFALGDFAAAHARFSEALRRDPRCLEDPVALHERAEAAVAVGDLPVAKAAYRALAPRVSLVESPSRQGQALVEAAAVVMSSGPDALDEAWGYLAEARRIGVGTVGEVFLDGLLALLLDRQGRLDEARGVVAEAGGPWAAMELVPLGASGGPPRVSSMPWLPDGERWAVVAVLAAREAPDVARDYWDAFLADSAAPDVWRAHAERKLAALGRGH